mmetsp:Transcript_46622/g.105366  ORF Transcript_46622/g.105366 Transcript_46622/m.105366 type:complete len:259 (-) Transcript_46622:1097-1873(-)
MEPAAAARRPRRGPRLVCPKESRSPPPPPPPPLSSSAARRKESSSGFFPLRSCSRAASSDAPSRRSCSRHSRSGPRAPFLPPRGTARYSAFAAGVHALSARRRAALPTARSALAARRRARRRRPREPLELAPDPKLRALPYPLLVLRVLASDKSPLETSLSDHSPPPPSSAASSSPPKRPSGPCVGSPGRATGAARMDSHSESLVFAVPAPVAPTPVFFFFEPRPLAPSLETAWLAFRASLPRRPSPRSGPKTAPPPP